ncbi:LytTR family DNA-binding domain-containing protein [Arthrobacter sp. AB6]|uniref:LytR/AlgR family response regulator transcription factor n=1 Tax=Arthrobacter sp. AB6 TaxID=2962570 RepID=UPI002882AC13|nr:LytTR family DNA-binding domain-containing protein [Arthrobacter sp. AB6]MDT0196680.1 LytTR family DNA-binding domain-containing protein [Arthrobacter sp. AB6]
MARRLNVLVTDDELPALEGLVRMLRQDSRIAKIYTASSGIEAIHALEQHEVDAVFLDIHMPSLSGIDIARMINRFANPPAVVFVTADETKALEAFDLKASDYLLKPVDDARLLESVRRLSHAREDILNTEPMVTVEHLGTSRLIKREDILYAEARGDYIRLHTEDASYLLRVAMAELERQWADGDFIRIHRSYLVSARHIQHMKLSAAKGSVWVDGAELPVSRRSLPIVRDLLNRTRVRSHR